MFRNNVSELVSIRHCLVTNDIRSFIRQWCFIACFIDLTAFHWFGNFEMLPLNYQYREHQCHLTMLGCEESIGEFWRALVIDGDYKSKLAFGSLGAF